MTTPLLTEGDLDRGRPPELKSPHWRCGIVDPATGATCTLRPHTDDKHHQGREGSVALSEDRRRRLLCGCCSDGECEFGEGY